MFLTRLPWGIGLACFFIPLITRSLTGLPSSKVASASGLFNFMRLITLSFGTSLSVTMWDRRQAYHDHVLSAHTSVSDPLTQQWLAPAQGLSGQQFYGALAHTISEQSFMLGLNEMYALAGCIFLGLTMAVWMSRSNE